MSAIPESLLKEHHVFRHFSRKGSDDGYATTSVDLGEYSDRGPGWLRIKKTESSKTSTTFSQITDYFREISRSDTAKNLPLQERATLIHNIEQWNKKIDRHNEPINTCNAKIAIDNTKANAYNLSIDQSCFWRMLEILLRFFSCGTRSLKYKTSSTIPTIEPVSTAQLSLPPWPNDGNRVNRWLRHHSADFVAHAVDKSNVNAVLDNGQILPGEAVLRKEKRIRYEGMVLNQLGERQEVILNLQTILDKVDPQIIQAWKSHQWVSFDPQTHLPVFHSLHQIQGVELQNNTRLVLDETQAQIPIDKQLAVVWKTCRIFAKTIPDRVEKRKYLSKCKIELNIARQEALKTVSHLRPRIHTLRYAIAWPYGNVVVLRGNPKRLIGQRITSLYHDEFALKTPYQNKGIPLGLSLNQSETIILGPRATLERYQEQYPNICYIEDLTPEQRAFFNVPQHLYTN